MVFLSDYHKGMIPFTLYNPTRIIFGPGEISKLAQQAVKIGKKPLVMFGKSSAKQSGLAEKVKVLLEAQGMVVTEFFGVEPNPRDTTCDKAGSLGRQRGCDMVIGVGGGSVMDAAKLTAAIIVSEKSTWDHVMKIVPTEEALPIILIPTLAATGSDFNSGAVITNWTMHQKLGCYSQAFYPTLSIIDPELTISCPINLTAWGGVDIIVHVMETYLSSSDSDCQIQDYFSEGVAKTVFENLPIALANPSNIIARTQLSWASAVALSGFPNGGRPGGFLLHWMEHVMTAYFDVPHGLGLAYILLHSQPYFEKYFPKRFQKFRSNVMPDPNQFLSSIDCVKTLEEMGVDRKQIGIMVDDLFMQKGYANEIPGYPGFDKKIAANIFKGSSNW